MNTTNQLLDRIKAQHNLPSDYAISKILGITRSAVSAYRKNKRQLDDSLAVKAAKLAEIDVTELVANLHRERAISDLEIKMWNDVESKNNFVKQVKQQDVIEALKAASNGRTTPTQRRLISKITELCILC